MVYKSSMHKATNSHSRLALKKKKILKKSLFKLIKKIFYKSDDSYDKIFNYFIEVKFLIL